ncbi:MAG: hypothetical protein GY854_17350 [Deltaproteobacteria bacterium]|nr:hypothetical protein [Deltaproteobacteria bacterium]
MENQSTNVDDYPVRELVEKRRPQSELQQKINALSKEIITRLGDDGKLAIDLEAQMKLFFTNRENEVFALGREYGFTHGETHAFRLLHQKEQSVEYQRLTNNLEALIYAADLPGLIAASALIELVWTLVVKAEMD